VDISGQPWTSVDSKAASARLWTPSDAPWPSTDQKVGGSSPPERAVEVRARRVAGRCGPRLAQHSAAVYPPGSTEKVSGEVGGLDCARLFEEVAGVVQQPEMPTVDVIPVLFTG